MKNSYNINTSESSWVPFNRRNVSGVEHYEAEAWQRTRTAVHCECLAAFFVHIIERWNSVNMQGNESAQSENRKTTKGSRTLVGLVSRYLSFQHSRNVLRLTNDESFQYVFHRRHCLSFSVQLVVDG